MIVREILNRTIPWLAGKGIGSARLDAEVLLARALDIERLQLYTDPDRPLIETELETYRGLLRRRAAGEPVAYLVGEKEFYGLTFAVSEAVLVPRPETELLVDRAVALGGSRLLDLGTGSGCIAIACAVQLPRARVFATDVSEAALDVARRNAVRHSVEDRVEFLAGDLLAPARGSGPFDLVMCNPPYVATGEADAVARFEPHVALFAGTDGLDVIRRVLREAPEVLTEHGCLLMEIAENQADRVRTLAAEQFDRVEIHSDLRRVRRLLEASRERTERNRPPQS